MRHAKASSTGSIMRQVSSLGRIFRGPLATTAAAPADGSGAPSGRRFGARLLVIGIVSTLATLAFGATAHAEAPIVEILKIDPVYTTAHVEATFDPNGGSASACWAFLTGEKEQIDNAPAPSQEIWSNRAGGCLGEAGPFAFDVANIPAGGTYYARIYVNNGEGGESPKVEFTTKSVNLPIATIDSVSEVTATTATFTGTVNANAPEEASKLDDATKAAYRTVFRFTNAGNIHICEPAPCAEYYGELNAGNDDLVTPHTFTAKTDMLTPNTVYTVKLIAENAGGPKRAGVGEMTFKTLPTPPVVSYLESAPANNVLSDSARVVGVVDKKNSPLTECYFEYGTTTDYGATAPCVPRADVPLMSADLTGLEPDTTYHFRLVAGNVEGSDVGDDRQFKTLSALPPEPTCANKAIRVEQKATYTGDCRAWEMVSPLDKNGGQVALEDDNAAATPDGEGVVFYSRGSFADTEGAGAIGMTTYTSKRTPSGWETHSALPRPAIETFQTAFFSGNSLLMSWSDDMTKGVLNAYDLPQASDDIAHGMNWYMVNLQTRQTETLTHPVEGENFFRRIEYDPFIFWQGRLGTSSDLHVISFESNVPLVEGAPSSESLYEFENGETRLASILPNGEPETNHVQMPLNGPPSRLTISRDGSFVTFLGSPEGSPQLYVRRNHTDTVWVSEPEGSDKSTPQGVSFQMITLDNKHILFMTTSALLDEDTNGGPDLYMYTDSPDPKSESNLSLISMGKNTDGGDVSGIIGASDDGSYVYYRDSKAGEGQIWLNKEGERRVILFPRISGDPSLQFEPGSFRVSRDGKRLAMMSKGGPDVLGAFGKYGISGTLNNGRIEMWVYDDATESTVCASCPPHPAGTVEKSPRNGATVEVEVFFIGITLGLFDRPDFFTADGKRAFFSTEEALVPEDVNGVMDAYEYNLEEGRIHLVSSGKGEWGSWFIDASEDGQDVFFGTREQIVRSDTDQLVDIYDSRAEGGYPEAPPPSTGCVGDGCRGAIPPPPSDISPATPRFAGPGDPGPKHKKKRKRSKHHKKANRGPKRAPHGHGGGK